MLKKNQSLILALQLSVVLAILHFLGIILYLYWSYWWFDILMHFLAGLIGGLTTYAVLWRLEFLPEEFWQQVLLVVGLVFIVGVAWEVFECVNGIIDSHEGYRLDIFNDLVLDTLGAFIGMRWASRKNHG